MDYCYTTKCRLIASMLFAGSGYCKKIALHDSACTPEEGSIRPLKMNEGLFKMLIWQ